MMVRKPPQGTGGAREFVQVEVAYFTVFHRAAGCIVLVGLMQLLSHYQFALDHEFSCLLAQ